MAILTKNSEFRFTGWHMLACMIAFFGVIIVVNFTMATFASKSWTGLVVKNSYVASQKFNDELALAEAQHARGWRSDVSYENGELVFALFDKAGKAINPDTVIASVGRPAFEQQDRLIELVGGAAHGHAVPLQLGEGTWALKIEAQAEGIAYRRDLRVFVSGGKGLIE